MERLSDEELKAILIRWRELPRVNTQEEADADFVKVFREAEREKGEARGFTPEEAQAHSDALKATMTPTGRGLFSTAYADKVLEVAAGIYPILLARAIEVGNEYTRASEAARKDSIADAQKLIQAANDAANRVGREP